MLAENSHYHEDSDLVQLIIPKLRLSITLRSEALLPLFLIYYQVKLFPFKQEFILI